MASSIVTPKTPAGTMELLPPEQAVFQRMLDTIRDKYTRYGFVQIETPVFEEVNVLLTKSGGETEKQVYFVQSTGSLEQGNKPDLALRFDLTVPLARYVAQHEHELAFPFRRFQIQRVYRGERAQKGRFREFYQCDIDIIGKDNLSPSHDAEIPAIIADIFRELKIGKFTINVSNRKILKGCLDSSGMTDKDAQTLVLREIDKAAKIGWDEVIHNLEKMGCTGDVLNLVLNLKRLSEYESGDQHINCFIGSRNASEHIKPLCKHSDEAMAGLAEIDLLLNMAVDMNVSDCILFNPTITRGLDYYTGTVYETFLNDHPGFGSICSGGRYDNLASHYTKSKLPGVGISIGLTRLFDQMRHAGLVAGASSSTHILVTRMDENLASTYLKAATDLRAAGISTAMYLDANKLGNQIKYADRAGIPYVVVIGGDEHARGVAQLKNLKTGEQKEVPLKGIGAAVKAII